MKLSFNKSTKKASFNVFLGLGLIIVFAVLFNYNKSKFGITDGFKHGLTSSEPSVYKGSDTNNLSDNRIQGLAEPGTDNYMPVSDSNTKPVMNREKEAAPSDLLPKGTNEWSDLNNVSEDLKSINLLSAGHHYGINTVGSSLRNPNLQIRSEPIIPKTNIGPWNNTTIDSDTTRRSLEIDGCD